MTEAKRKKANLVALLIQQGWNPPRPTDRIVHAIAEDIERIDAHNPSLDLSPAQLEVVAFAAQGYTRDETASMLGISMETVKSRTAIALQRLGAKNVAHAVALCIRSGLLDTEGQSEQAA